MFSLKQFLHAWTFHELVHLAKFAKLKCMQNLHALQYICILYHDTASYHIFLLVMWFGNKLNTFSFYPT